MPTGPKSFAFEVNGDVDDPGRICVWCERVESKTPVDGGRVGQHGNGSADKRDKLCAIRKVLKWIDDVGSLYCL